MSSLFCEEAKSHHPHKIFVFNVDSLETGAAQDAAIETINLGQNGAFDLLWGRARFVMGLPCGAHATTRKRHQSHGPGMSAKTPA